jgi:chemotaxis-related protein WspB
MLGLLVQAAGARLAIDVRDVAQVLPLASLRSHSPAPHSLAGLLLLRGGVVPVFDLGAIREGIPTSQLLRTRLMLIEARGADALPPYALIVDQVIDARPFDEAIFRPDKLLLDDQGPIHVLDPNSVLPFDAQEWLRAFATAEVDG